MSSRLNRLAGNIEPETTYGDTVQEKSNLEKIQSNIKEKEEVRKRDSERKVNNQKYNIKYGDETKIMWEAQKQIEGIKFDYQMMNLLLERNADNFSKRDRDKYNILMDN